MPLILFGYYISPMTIIKTTFPNQSLLNRLDKRYDYVDSFEGTVVDKDNKLKSVDVAKAFFSSSPKWVDKLFKFRNKLVSLLGLKSSGNNIGRQKVLDNFKCELGDQIGLFKVFDKTDDEVVLGEDDKHLNFRVSLFLDKPKDDGLKKSLIISTTVVFNNRFGRLYFLPVRPFHKFIVPIMLKGIIKQLEAHKH